MRIKIGASMIKQVHALRWDFIGALFSFVLALAVPTGVCAQAINQGDYQALSPAMQPSGLNLTPDYVRKFTPKFWAGGTLYSYLQAGTVLTGTLQDKLSSKNNKVGDVFAILLADGYSEGAREVLPKGSKIVGTVVSVVPGKSMTNGSPGRLDISLQTLVLPDGRSAPIYGLIERNPNLEPKQDPSKPKKGLPLAEYGHSLKNSVAALGNAVTRRGLGMQLYYPGRTGLDFTLEPGELLPIRLSSPLDVTTLMRQPIPRTSMGAAGLPSAPLGGEQQGRPSVPGLAVDEQVPPAAPPFKPRAQGGSSDSVFDGNELVPGRALPDPF